MNYSVIEITEESLIMCIGIFNNFNEAVGKVYTTISYEIEDNKGEIYKDYPEITPLQEIEGGDGYGVTYRMNVNGEKIKRDFFVLNNLEEKERQKTESD